MDLIVKVVEITKVPKGRKIAIIKLFAKLLHLQLCVIG